MGYERYPIFFSIFMAVSADKIPLSAHTISSRKGADCMNPEKEIREAVEENGQMTLDGGNARIHLLSVIGEIEGHECAPSASKTTKYEHVLPQLAAVEDSDRVDGLLVLINTVGGDISAGLALAEMTSASLPFPLCWETVIPSACRWPCLRIIHLSYLPGP